MKRRLNICFVLMTLVILTMTLTAYAMTEEECFNQGYALYMEGQYSEALVLFESAIELNPAEGAYDEWKGACLFNMAKFTDALESFESSIAKDAHPSPYEYKGICLYMMDQMEEALEAFNVSITMAPYSNNCLWKAVTLLRLERYDEAAEAYQAVTCMNGVAGEKKAVACNNQGYAFLMDEQYEAAMEAINKGLAISSSQSALYKNKGLILEHGGQYEAALAAYKQAISMDSDYEKALTALDDLQEKMQAELDPDHYRVWGEIVKDVRLIKVWTVRCNQPIDFQSIQGNVIIVDQDGSRLPVNILSGDDDKCFEVHLVNGFYRPGVHYTLYIKKGIESSQGKVLKKGIMMPFMTTE